MKRKETSRFYEFSRRLLLPFFKIFLGLRAYGQEWFPKEGGVIVAPNHLSIYDPIVVGIVSPRELHFLGKIELFRIPILSKILPKLNTIPLQRSGGDVSALRAAFQVLQERHPLLVFPEGTRSRSGRLQKAKGGVGMLAWKNGMDILPVHVSGTFKIGYNFWRKRITVRFGRPIRIDDFRKFRLSDKEIYRKIGEETMFRIKRLQDDHHN